MILLPEEFVIRGAAPTLVHALTRRDFGSKEFAIFQDGTAVICRPVDWFDPSQFALGVVSLACSSLSLVALAATFVTYCVFPELRNLAGLYTMNLVVAIFLAILLLVLVGNFDIHGYLCVATASTVHLSWLSAFFWMAALSYSGIHFQVSLAQRQPARV